MESASRSPSGMLSSRGSSRDVKKLLKKPKAEEEEVSGAVVVVAGCLWRLVGVLKGRGTVGRGGS